MACVAGATLLPLIAVAAFAASVTPGTPTQVAAAVTQSVNITSIPANLTPSLTTFESHSSYSLSGLTLFHTCDPYYFPALAAAPKACYLGDKSSTKTIVIIGDSNVGNWLPALNNGLFKSHYRLAVFAFEGCPMPDLTYTATTDPSSFAACNTWHAHVGAAVRALKPIAVIADSGAVDLSVFTNAQWTNGVKEMFTQTTYHLANVKRILFGTSPFFSFAVPGCVASNTDPQKCASYFQIGTGYYGQFVARDPLIATAAKATLVPTYQWFCTGDHCSPIVSKFLVYVDADHLSTAYSDYLSTVATDAVTTALKP